MKSCSEEKLRNVFLAVRGQDALGSHMVSFPFSVSSHSHGDYPMAQAGLNIVHQTA